jgi:hypothetical protein
MHLHSCACLQVSKQCILLGLCHSGDHELYETAAAGDNHQSWHDHTANCVQSDVQKQDILRREQVIDRRVVSLRLDVLQVLLESDLASVPLTTNRRDFRLKGVAAINEPQPHEHLQVASHPFLPRALESPVDRRSHEGGGSS